MLLHKRVYVYYHLQHLCSIQYRNDQSATLPFQVHLQSTSELLIRNNCLTVLNLRARKRCRSGIVHVLTYIWMVTLTGGKAGVIFMRGCFQ